MLSNLQGDTLIITADNNTWATQLRLITPELLKLLHAKPGFAQVKQIRCRVSPASTALAAKVPKRKAAGNPSKHHKRHPARKLSKRSAAIIESAASEIKHTKLRAALLRWAAQSK